VEIHREYPICVTLATGEIVEGVIDVAWSDGNTWTVVDYKTGRAERRHQAQVQLYAFALQQATGLPARAVVLDI
jgi:ATP-dependent exoDNAse (exonuclease V) beta subunit